jgi:uncharacterized protein (TIGR02453 family)
MNERFTQKTFQYFEGAQKNKNNQKWFEKNKALYQDRVRQPMAFLLQQIDLNYRKELPQIDLSPAIITRPLRPKNRAAAAGSLVKNFSHFTAWQKKTSLFEWNPGIHFQVGAKKDDNFFGLGLYMVSSRQTSLLRYHLTDDFEEIDAILQDRKLKKVWGEILGDKYKRFPKGYSADDSKTKYLWHKQFYLGQEFSRKAVIDKKFVQKCVDDLEIALPFFAWVRAAVGTYSKRSIED